MVDVHIILNAFPYLSCAVGLGRKAIDAEEDIGAVKKVFHECDKDRTSSYEMGIAAFVEDCHLGK